MGKYFMNFYLYLHPFQGNLYGLLYIWKLFFILQVSPYLLQEDKMSELKPRAYQLELYEHAKKQNSILVLGTGSGKTFISILLIKDLGHQVCNGISLVGMLSLWAM